MKLGNLLKKELRELLTVQAIVSMLFTCILLIGMGQIMGGIMEEAINNTKVNIAVLDDSEFTEKMLEALPEYGSDPNIISAEGFEGENYFDAMKKNELSSLVIIPEGFGDSVENSLDPAEIKCVSVISGGGVSSSVSTLSASGLTGSISSYVSDYYQTNVLGLDEEHKERIYEPVANIEYTCANEKTVQVSGEALQSMLMSQSMIAPIAVFFLLMMAAQMIMTAISTEKIDKTLETLLSAPVSRLSVLTAKMIAALIVALLNAGFMIVGFIFYIQGMMGSAVEMEAAQAGESFSIADAMMQLGLTLSAGQIVLFGVQLFLTIAIGLSLSLVLGAMATDVKSVQTLVLPIMMLSMIPFIATMFTDVNSLSPAVKTILYIIPFTHTYTAMSNLMFGNTAIFWGGFAYQLVFFAVCMYLAVRMFTTDLLFTMSFSADKGLKRKKKAVASEENVQ